jgi:uncharacterized protein YecE (DUF72 family)
MADLFAEAAFPSADNEPESTATLPVGAATPDPELLALAPRLQERWGSRLRLGTSSWHFPGWAGQVWDRPRPEARLSRHGLAAYAKHPLLRTVSLDRSFYRPLDAASYRQLAAQVAHAEGFQLIVKAPALLTDAMLRDPATGAPRAPNPLFLDPDAAITQWVQPAAEGLGAALGVLVLQLSPLPARWLKQPDCLFDRLDTLLAAIVSTLPAGAQVALELRDPALLGPPLVALLQRHPGARYCLGLHDRMPPAEDQLPLLRALWPADLICRWNLQRGQRYAQARDAWAPFDRLRAPDIATRATLARVAAATLDAGRQVFITINNKAEGSAPASVRALGEALDAQPHRA